MLDWWSVEDEQMREEREVIGVQEWSSPVKETVNSHDDW